MADEKQTTITPSQLAAELEQPPSAQTYLYAGAAIGLALGNIAASLIIGLLGTGWCEPGSFWSGVLFFIYVGLMGGGLYEVWISPAHHWILGARTLARDKRWHVELVPVAGRLVFGIAGGAIFGSLML